jgi:hypothetical protein
MEKNTHQFNPIAFDSPRRITHTNEYREQVEKIRDEINLKYSKLLTNEKNPFKRIYLQIKQIRETKRAIRQLTSFEKLYVSN